MTNTITTHVPLSDATLRALKRVEAGEKPIAAARSEGIAPSTLFRQLAKQRPQKLYLVIDKKPDGGFDAWVENQSYKQAIPDASFSTVAELQAALPGLLAQY